MRKNERYKIILDWFREHMPVVQTELHYRNNFELLVAVVLSAQCTDKRVNLTTPALFEAYPSAKEMAQAPVEDIFQLIRSISYPNSKANHLKKLSEILIEKFGGEVPQTREELMIMPGVGRKTANVLLSVLFGQPTMAVDTHVFRVSKRLGLAPKAKTPLDTELELVKHIPNEYMHDAHHWLILHGRYVCLARKPKCDACGLTMACQYYNSQNKNTKPI